MGREGNPLRIMLEVYIWPYEQVVYAQTRIHRGEWDAESSLGFSDTNGSSNLGQTTRPSDSQQQKKSTCRIVDLPFRLTTG